MEIKWIFIRLLIVVVRLQYTCVSAQTAPTNVYFQVNLLNYLTVSWTPPADLTGVAGYFVEYTIVGEGTGTSEIIQDPAITTLTVQDNNLVNGLDGVLIVPLAADGTIDPNNIVQAAAPPANAFPPAPTGATKLKTSDTSYTLTWVNPGNVDGFVISYARDTGAGFAEITGIDLPVGRTSEQIRGLMPNANYVFNLYSQRNGIRTLGTLSVIRPGVLPPEDTIITIDQLGTDFINFIWDHDATQGILSYAVTLFDSTGHNVVVNQQLLPPVASMTHRFSGLIPGTQFTIDVDIITVNGQTDFARELQYTRPKPPENIFLYQISDSAVLFRWEPPSAPNNFFQDYVVQYQDTDTLVSLENVLPIGASSNAIHGLTAGTTYNFGVFSIIDPITSDTSQFTHVILASNASGVVNIEAVTATDLEVLWQYSAQNVESYDVRLFSEDGIEQYFQTPATRSLSTIFQELTPDTLYIALVEAVATDGTLSNVGSDTARTNYLPDGTNVTVNSTTATTVTLLWTSDPTASSYVISYISSDGTNTATFTSAGTGTTANVPDLQPQTTYSFSVAGTNGTTSTNIGTAVGTTSTASTTVSIPMPVITPEPKAAINYTPYIAVTVIVLLLLVIVAVLCYKRRNSTSDPKNANGEREQSGNQSEPSTELRSSPLSVVSRKYDTTIEITSPKVDPLPEGQLSHEYQEPPHLYTEIL